MNDEPGGLLLRLERSFNSTRARVFSLLTEPAGLARWWGPHGFTTPDISLSLVVGGHYRFSMKPPEGDLFHLSGKYLEIDPPRRLVYTFSWEEPTPDDRETVVSLSLADAGDATRVTLLQGQFSTEERLALHRSGWTEAFEKLRDVLRSSDLPRDTA